MCWNCSVEVPCFQLLVSLTRHQHFGEKKMHSGNLLYCSCLWHVFKKIPKIWGQNKDWDFGCRHMCEKCCQERIQVAGRQWKKMRYPRWRLKEMAERQRLKGIQKGITEKDEEPGNGSGTWLWMNKATGNGCGQRLTRHCGVTVRRVMNSLCSKYTRCGHFFRANFQNLNWICEDKSHFLVMQRHRQQLPLSVLGVCQRV